MSYWTWRERIAYRIHQLGYRFSPPVEQGVLPRDGDGKEIFSISFTDGFVATGPIAPYTAHSRHYVSDDDLVGQVEDW